MWLIAKAMLSGIFGFLKSIPWQVWAFGLIGFVAWRWHVGAVNDAVSHNVYQQVYAVRLQWLAETMREDEEAIRERDKWQAFIDQRNADRAAFREQLATESAAKLRARAAERAAVAKLNEEVTRDVLDNPSPAICVLSDDSLRLRTEQICAANKAAGWPCSGVGQAGASGLPRSGQDAATGAFAAYRWPHGQYADG